jgi:hypothetical protein
VVTREMPNRRIRLKLSHHPADVELAGDIHFPSFPNSIWERIC